MTNCIIYSNKFPYHSSSRNMKTFINVRNGRFDVGNANCTCIVYFYNIDILHGFSLLNMLQKSALKKSYRVLRFTY